MSASHVAIDALLVLAVAVELLSCAGLVAMRTTLQRTHYVGTLAVPCAILTGAAVALGGHVTSGTGLKAAFIAVVLVIFAPLLAHATVQAVAAREGDG